MEIISKVEIGYFRSIYSSTLNPCRDINVFIGGNDVGKSNVLKALNLFFNNETDLGTQYSFVSDITKFRESEAASAKGRASIWIKVTFNNIFGWVSLPEKITIKKSWNRYSQNADITYFPQKFNGKNILQQTVSKFLNKISFFYIPAVRSRQIFSYYLGMLHDALLDDTKVGLANASKELTQTINSAVDKMSFEINEKLGFQSTIQVPQDFRDLFEALDFSTKFGDFDIPLQSRGDGIQARHIPFILHFVAKKSAKSHIWAYEEPENSLEMSKAFELARQFKEDFSKDTQIFLTTHSPAFYDLSGEKVSKWFAKSNPHKNSGNKTTEISMVEDNIESDASLGIAELVKTRAKAVFEEKERLDLLSKKLEMQLATYQKPVVITEGKTDVIILTTAWEKLYPSEEMPFDICSCNVAAINDQSDRAGVKLLAQYLDSVLQNELSLKIGIFDRDQAGKEYFNNHLKQFSQKTSKDLRRNRNGKAYALLLPSIPGEDSEEYWDKTEIPIEFLFPKKYLTSDYVKTILKQPGGNELSDDQAREAEKNLLLFRLFKKEYRIKNKDIFANNKVLLFPQEAFKNFRTLFDVIRSIIV